MEFADGQTICGTHHGTCRWTDNALKEVNYYEVLCLGCTSLVLKVHIEQRPVAVEARSLR